MVGCGSQSTVAEGKVKVETHSIDSLTRLLMNTATDTTQSMMATMILPVNEQFEIEIIKEEFINGELVGSQMIISTTTRALKKESVIYLILHPNISETESRFAIVEVDLASKSDELGLEHSLVMSTFPSNFRSEEVMSAWTFIEEFEGALDNEIILAVNIESSTGELTILNTEEYKDRTQFKKIERGILFVARFNQKKIKKEEIRVC